MDKYAIDECLKRLDLLSEKLGLGAAKVFPWFVRQVYIDCIALWLLFIGSAILSYTLANYSIRHWHPTKRMGCDDRVSFLNKGNYDIIESDHELIWTLTLIVTFATSVATLILIARDGFAFLNPGYYAMHNIAKMLLK
jgi:hypothetical protein